MKTKITFITLLLMALTLTGCATGPVFSEYVNSIPAVPADKGRIYFYRTSTLGALIKPSVRVNEEVVGKAVALGFFYVDLPAGNYQIATSTEAKRSLSLSLKTRQTRYVRLEVKMGLLAGHIKPVLVENSVGMQEIVDTKYIGEQ